MKIVDVTTTLLRDPEGFVIQDATIFPPAPGAHGRSALFVHVKTDEGVDGLGTTAGHPAVRAVVEQTLREALIGQDPFDVERLWNQMFWRVRGFGRKGIAFCAVSAFASHMGLRVSRMFTWSISAIGVFPSFGRT